jgi:hypothetical protein
MTWPGANYHTGYMAPPQIRGSAPSSLADVNLAMTSESMYGDKFSPDVSLAQTVRPTDYTMYCHPSVESLARDPVLFVNNGASNQNPENLPRQDSYNSHGSAAEYFTSDDLPPVSEEMFHFEISADVMRDMERIEDQFDHPDSRSIHDRKRSTKRWWVSEKVRKVVRYVYMRKVFRRNRKSKDMGVETVQVVGTVEEVDGRIRNFVPQQEQHPTGARRRTESSPVLMMVTSSEGIVQEPEHYHEARNAGRRVSEPIPAKQEERKDSKIVEDVSSREETVVTTTTIRVKSESKENAHQISEGETVHDIVADIIASTQNLKLEQEQENDRSSESIITVKAGATVV